MKILLQRVQKASVAVDGNITGSIGSGYLLFVGVMEGDTLEQGQWLSEKISKLRLFNGKDGPPGPDGRVRTGTINDASILDVGGEILVVSQFTLAGRTEKGSRPDYTKAAKPDIARQLYEAFIHQLKNAGIKKVEQGVFGAHMDVSLVNDGPVTLIIER